MDYRTRRVAVRRDPHTGVSKSDLLGLNLRGRLKTDSGVVTGGDDVNLTDLHTPDADGIKTSIATVAVALLLGPPDFDGDAVTDGLLTVPRNITISRSDSASSYTTDPIKVAGFDAEGRNIVERLIPDDEDGDDELVTTNLFVGEVWVHFPAQADDSGAFEIGVGASLAIEPPCDGVYFSTAGELVVTLRDEVATRTTIGTTQARMLLPYGVKAVHAVTDTDAVYPRYQR